VFVLSLSKRRYDALTDRQRGWVREAAAQAVTASATATYDETSLAKQLCGQGARFAALRARVTPVVARLAADRRNGPVLKEVQAVAAAHPATETPRVDLACRLGLSAATGTMDVPATVSALPAGVYRVELTVADVTGAGLPGGAGFSGIWTVTVRDGRYEVICHPKDEPGLDCGHSVSSKPNDVGDLRGAGDVVYFVPDLQRLSKAAGCTLPPSESRPGACGPNEPFRVTWRADGATLRFGPVDGDGPGAFTVEPFRKIG
jgi:hypothetical protein